MTETVHTSVQIIGGAYLFTLQGICKIIEAVASFIGVLLVGIGYDVGYVDLFEVAASISIVVSVLLLIFYVSTLVAKVKISWNRVQFFFHIVWSVLYLIAVALVFDRASGFDRVIAGGVFGLIALLAHIVDAIDNYRKQPLF